MPSMGWKVTLWIYMYVVDGGLEPIMGQVVLSAFAESQCIPTNLASICLMSVNCCEMDFKKNKVDSRIYVIDVGEDSEC